VAKVSYRDSLICCRFHFFSFDQTLIFCYKVFCHFPCSSRYFRATLSAIFRSCIFGRPSEKKSLFHYISLFFTVHCYSVIIHSFLSTYLLHAYSTGKEISRRCPSRYCSRCKKRWSPLSSTIALVRVCPLVRLTSALFVTTCASIQQFIHCGWKKIARLNLTEARIAEGHKFHSFVLAKWFQSVPHITQWFLWPRRLHFQMALRSFYLFLRGSLSWSTERHTHRQTTLHV